MNDLQEASYLSQGLKYNGYCVDVVLDGVLGLDMAIERDHSLVLIDEQLPGMDGLSYLKCLRAARSVPVIVLHLSKSAVSKMSYLEEGASDCLGRPVAVPELLSRVGFHVRRANFPAGVGAEFKIADFTLDLSRKRAERAGRRLSLTYKEFAMVMVLAERPGALVTRDVLVDRVWRQQPISLSNLHRSIGRLRRKIDQPGQLPLLHTIKEFGYLLGPRRG
ncbi:DNA-binding response regulator [Pseudorhodoferax aquiterrae]|uniref:DNA-binding response regulator n=2 Tax=Pseudorhodoferax aquiterrae TaxID=747304 RepID=A0ABQ3G674_9BURK|nr:DNA-binding response regulator [Pseudorhodoferax aquiterrae]